MTGELDMVGGVGGFAVAPLAPDAPLAPLAPEAPVAPTGPGGGVVGGDVLVEVWLVVVVPLGLPVGPVVTASSCEPGSDEQAASVRETMSQGLLRCVMMSDSSLRRPNA
jgi:hypothetical protein